MIRYFCDECKKEITYENDSYFVGRSNDIQFNFCSTECLQQALTKQDVHWPTRKVR